MSVFKYSDFSFDRLELLLETYILSPEASEVKQVIFFLNLFFQSLYHFSKSSKEILFASTSPLIDPDPSFSPLELSAMVLSLSAGWKIVKTLNLGSCQGLF